jgi:hypothetical protein
MELLHSSLSFICIGRRVSWWIDCGPIDDVARDRSHPAVVTS